MWFDKMLREAGVFAQMEELGIQKDKLTREVEAESIAYCVCQYFGLDTSAENECGDKETLFPHLSEFGR